jgi:oligosaccharide repeat unit polymerase
VLAIVLAVPIAAAGALLVHRVVHGGRVGMTPLAGYAAAWITVIGMYMVDPLGLDQVTSYAWLLIGASFVTFVVGYSLAMSFGIRPGKEKRTTTLGDATANPGIVRQVSGLWCVCLAAGVGLFSIYLYELASIYGLSGNTLSALRIDTSVSSPPPGFYFYVFAEPLVPMSVVLALFNPSRRKPYLATAALATLALLATSGRANALFALLWAFCAFGIYQGSRLVRFKTALIAIATIVVALAIFQFLGDLVGKTYQHSYTYSVFGDQPPIPSQLVGPYLYLEGPLPTLSAVVDDTNSFGLGRFTFRPVLKVLAVFDHDVNVPSQFPDFQLIPYPFNVSTYLGYFYRDFGIAGVLLGPAIVGFFVGLLYAKWRQRPSPATLCLAAFAAVVATSSTFDFPLADLSRLLEVAAIAAVAVLETRSQSSVTKRVHAKKVFSRT